MDTRWKHPWTSMLCGPTGCGKTEFVKRFLKYIDRMSDTRFQRVIFYYAEWQSGYRDLGKNIEFREGLPRSEDYTNDPRPKLLILDDLMRESSSSSVIVNLFTKGSHHKNISVIFITQNIFHKGKSQRDISLNTKYLVLYKNPRDRAQIQHLARQVYPEDPKFLQEAYLDATRTPHTYLFLDLSQDCLDEFRFRSCIFPDDKTHYAYVLKYSKFR